MLPKHASTEKIHYREASNSVAQPDEARSEAARARRPPACLEPPDRGGNCKRLCLLLSGFPGNLPLRVERKRSGQGSERCQSLRPELEWKGFAVRGEGDHQKSQPDKRRKPAYGAASGFCGRQRSKEESLKLLSSSPRIIVVMSN